MTANCTSLALNLRWVAWAISFFLRFLFIRLPSTRRCGLAETVGLCFRVDSDCVTLGFVLGLVCVCVCFVLFCSVVSFVVGKQQHCRYIVIDAMVYPRNWILEDELSTGKTLGVFELSLVFLYLVFATEKILNLEVTTLCMSWTRWVLDDALSSTLCFGRRVLLWISFDHGYDLEREHFSADIRMVSVPGSDVSGWDVMSKGGMEIWRPMGAPFG